MQKDFDPKDAVTAMAKGEVQTVEVTPEEIRAYLAGEELPENLTSALDEAQGAFGAGRATSPEYILIRVRHIA